MEDVAKRVDEVLRVAFQSDFIFDTIITLTVVWRRCDGAIHHCVYSLHFAQYMLRITLKDDSCIIMPVAAVEIE
jgi:hypothetical protein